MLEISSTTNKQIVEHTKLQQKKYRKETDLFLLEGFKPIKEAVDSGVEIITLYTIAKYTVKYDFLKSKTVVVTEAVLKKLSTTDSMPEAVAVAKQQHTKLNEIKNSRRIALLENIKDAGNLGTIIRSAAAFNIEAIILCGETIDLYNPKVVRSAAGNLFKAPIFTGLSSRQIKEEFKNHNFIATVVNHNDTVKPESIDYNSPFILMLGSEAEGLTDTTIELANTKTTIEIADNVESLNLSIAASIFFYITLSK